MPNQDISEEKREMFREYGRQGGRKAAEMLGSEEMSRRGKLGRAKQLSSETDGTPRTPRVSSGNAGAGLRNRAKPAVQPADRPDDPLMNL